MTDGRVLVVEDEADQRQLVSDILRSEDYLVSDAASTEAALEQLSRAPVDLVLSDWKLPGGDGMELLETIRRDYPDTAFIMVTAYGTISHAVAAVRAGADDYLAKPFERQTLLLALRRTLKARRLEDENRRLTEALAERERLVHLLGRAPSMQSLYRRVQKLAPTEATVLISGESGTGKELCARALHQLSPRASRPFVAVNCAAVPEGLIESEFFGVEKGAFTGANESREGRFEQAGGGTLFLDEVGELPLALQPKLLRALQERTMSRVGGKKDYETDVRVIAASNRSLEEGVAVGEFREDLYYRLNVVPLTMPPLRDRREDIPMLVEHFKDESARRHGLRVDSFPRPLMRRLIDYSWPGNVRELKNVVERLILLAEDGRVSSDDLPDVLSPAPTQTDAFELPPGGISWEGHERNCLQQALEMAGGNRSRAARLLELPYKAFLYRLEKHKLTG